MSITVFTCDPWESYIHQLIALGDREQAERDLDDDLAHEHDLGRAWLRGTSECPWPWYADKPYIVCRPQVFTR